MRKSPVRHRVRQHTRKGKVIHSYERGRGNRIRNSPTKKVRIRKSNPTNEGSLDFWGKKQETKPFDFWSEEKAQEEVNKEILQEKAEKEKLDQTKPDIPYYSRDDLEKMFIGDTEEEVRSLADELHFEFEKETLKPDIGERILEFRYPIDTDMEPGIQETDMYREINFIMDLESERVVRIESYMSSAPEDRWGKTTSEY